ncbi:MAG: hypothetical protein ACKVXR_04770 [Planctomycetota bacterium]
MFVVQVIDDAGREQGIEVQAQDADHARAIVRATGADGTIGKVWLKRFVAATEHRMPAEGARDVG